MIHGDPAIIAYSILLNESFRHWTGRALIEGNDIASTLFAAPFPVLSHGTESDPLICYGNRAALTLWQMEWSQFIGLPSRRSAEPVVGVQKDRNGLLRTAMQKGWIDDYTGIRISATGRRFCITDTIVWNVVDSQGTRHGQAARIGSWQWI